MDSDGTPFKFHLIVKKRAVAMLGIPPKIDSGITHGVVGDEGVFHTVNYGGRG